jgi:hypothetical protein
VYLSRDHGQVPDYLLEIGIKMSIRIILFYDQYARDFSQMAKLKKELESHNAVCQIAPSMAMMEHAILFKPDAIVIGNPDLYHGEFATLLSDKTVVFSIPTEQSIFTAKIFAERVVEGHNRNNTNYEPPNTAIVRRFFLWSEYHRESLLAAGIPAEKLFVSGNPRLTLLKDKRQARCIGVPLETQFSQSLPYDLWALDGIDTGYGSMVDYFSLAVDILDKQLKVIRALTQESYKVIVRPRLSDMSTDYSFLGENVEIDRSPDPSYLLNKCEYIVTGQSTIGLEAYVHGGKVVSVLGLVKQSLITDVMTKDLLFQHPLKPSSIEELLQVLGGTSDHPQSEVFLDKVRFYLGANIANPEKRMADEIIKVMEESRSGIATPEVAEARIRIANKFNGIRGSLIKNRDNAFGALLSKIILARQQARKLVHRGLSVIRTA